MEKEIDYYKKYQKYKQLYLVEKNKNISDLVENFDWDKFNMKLNKNQKTEIKKFFNVCKELGDWKLGSDTSLKLISRKYSYYNLNFYENKNFDDNFGDYKKNEYYIDQVIKNYLNLDDYTNIYYYKFPISVDEIDDGTHDELFWFFFGKYKDGNYIMLILKSHGCGVYCEECSQYYAFINNKPKVILSEIRVNFEKKYFQLERNNLMTELRKNIKS